MQRAALMDRYRRRRLMRDVAVLCRPREEDGGFMLANVEIAIADEDDLSHWVVRVHRPEAVGEGAEAGGEIVTAPLYFSVLIPETYPAEAPKVVAHVRIPHTAYFQPFTRRAGMRNIAADTATEVCLDMLTPLTWRPNEVPQPYAGWSTSYSLESLCMQLHFMHDEIDRTVTSVTMQQSIQESAEAYHSVHGNDWAFLDKHGGTSASSARGDSDRLTAALTQEEFAPRHPVAPPQIVWLRVLTQVKTRGEQQTRAAGTNGQRLNSADSSSTTSGSGSSEPDPATKARTNVVEWITVLPRRRPQGTALSGPDTTLLRVVPGALPAHTRASAAVASTGTKVQAMCDSNNPFTLLGTGAQEAMQKRQDEQQRSAEETEKKLRGLRKNQRRAARRRQQRERELQQKPQDNVKCATDTTSTASASIASSPVSPATADHKEKEEPRSFFQLAMDKHRVQEANRQFEERSRAAITGNELQAAGPLLGKLPSRLICQALLYLEAPDVSSALATCRYMAYQSTHPHLWRTLTARSYPVTEWVADELVPGAAKFVFQLEANGVPACDLRCFVTHETFTDGETVLGFPIKYTTNPRTRQIDYIYTPCQLMSRTAWRDLRVRRDQWGGHGYMSWIPVYISAEHFDRALPILLRQICALAPGSRAADAEVGIGLLCKLFNTMVVLLADDSHNPAEHETALRGLCLIHRLLLACVDRYSSWRTHVEARVRSFMRDAKKRSKEHVPALGEFMPLLSVCQGVGWCQIVWPLLEESMARQVLWVCRDHPELAHQTTPASAAATTGGRGGDSGVDMDLLSKWFHAARVSLRVMRIHAAFLRHVVHPGGAPLALARQRHDRFWGIPPIHTRRAFMQEVRQVMDMSSWPEFFRAIHMQVPSPATLTARWQANVKASERSQYHNERTDFSRVQRSGVSQILMRGAQLPRAIFLIDTSSSMWSPAGVSGKLSRLDLVKRVFKAAASQLTPQQQFDVINFNSYASAWATGWVQATASNVRAAIRHVNSWQPAGATALYEALEMAFSAIRSSRGLTSGIYLLSDGEPTVGPGEEEIMRLVRQFHNDFSDVPIHATGLDMSPYGMRLLTEIARVAGGTELRVDSRDVDANDLAADPAASPAA